MFDLPASEVARMKSMHHALIQNSLKDKQSLLYEHLDVENRNSFVLIKCECKTNPHCTGFVLGVLDFDTGGRICIMMKREQLAQVLSKVWEKVAPEVRQ